ncbi:MAG: penicillin-binding transpeptidase domain-containing protein [Oscillospiraceae bacterium]
MKKLVSTGRLFAFGLLVVALLALCVGTLYKLQIIEGAAYYEESQNKQVSEQTVTAARGNILDRYGRVLVSNRECYNLKISDKRLFSDEVEDPNAVILQMINMVEAAGDKYTDDLPITKEPPFEYTNMTDIQRMLLNAYLKDKGLDEDTTAVELMSYFRTRYDIAGSYNAEEMRKIASVRYAVNVRYAINTNPYVFVEDASIDLISDLMGVVGNVVEVETSYIREYNTQYAAHILGYVQAMSDADMEKYRPGKENSTYDYDTKVGKDGVELAFENWLHGTNGKATVERTASGTVTSTIYTEDPVPGNHVYLTIDIQLQEAVERILETGIQTLQLKRDEDNLKAVSEGRTDDVREDIQGGAIVVVDIKTGEPLAIASYPTYNLSTLLEDYDEISSTEYDPLFNRALLGAYAPGSTFKPCTAIAGLSENIINTETQILCDGVFTKYADQGYAPECWIYTQDHLTHGNDNVTEALKDSCNIFFYTMADNLGIRKLMEYAEDFGLGESTGIELVETTGNMANPDNHLTYDVDEWVDGDTVQTGIGQSDSLFTPLQLAEYCAAIANGGTRHSAALLKSVRSFDYSRQLYQKDTEALSTVETADYNWAAVQRGMYLMANDISSSSLTVYYALGNYSYNGVSLPVAAKTGTSQLGEDKTNNAIFMCYAPFDDPQIAISIVVERGQAGANLSSMARNVLDAYFGLGDKSSTADSEYTLLK